MHNVCLNFNPSLANQDMKFNPRTVHLRVGAVVITFYTICFICGVAWNTYTISCKENIGFFNVCQINHNKDGTSVT